MKLVSALAGDPTTTATGSSVATTLGSVSDDGRYVVYLSDATDLVANQQDSAGTNDVFLFDKQENTTILLSRAAGTTTTTADGTSYNPTISGDGKWVAFVSEATNLIAGVEIPFTSNLNPTSQLYLYSVEANVLSLVTYAAGSTTVASAGNDTDTATPSLSHDGRYLAFVSNAPDLITGQSSSVDGNSISPRQDAFLYDRLAHDRPDWQLA